MTANLPPHLNRALREMLDRRGLPDLAALAALAPDTVQHPGWGMDDTPGWWRAKAESVLREAVPAGFAGATLDDAPDEVCHWLARHEADPQRYPWLLLNGLTGRGKTHLAWALIMHLVRAAAARQRGYVFRVVSNATLNHELRIKPDGSHNTALDKYLKADMTVYDDIGAGNINDYAIEGALRLLDHRIDRRLPMILTSNLGGKQMAEIMSDRVLSRVTVARRVQVDGPDRRIGSGWSS